MREIDPMRIFLFDKLNFPFALHLFNCFSLVIAERGSSKISKYMSL